MSLETKWERERWTHDRDEILRDDLVEAGNQRLDLLLDGRVQAVVRRKLHELLLVLLSDRDGRPALLQLDELRDAKLERNEASDG